ncbi:uncharacterized protein LOC144106850 isoform X1 [Amblyomma americanum]
MANFGLFKGISTADKAYMVNLGTKSGHHFYFENTMEYIEEINFPTPLPKKIGYNAIICVFLSFNNGWAEIGMRAENGGFLTNRVGPSLCFEAVRRKSSKHKTEVRYHGYIADAGTPICLSVRIIDARQLKVRYEHYESFVEDIGDTLNQDLRIYVKVRVHRLMSLHVIVENDSESTPWASDSILWDRPFPMQTKIIYTVRPKRDNPPDVYIELPGEGETKIHFTNNVKKGQLLVFMVRLATDGIVVTNEFDPSKKYAVFQRTNEKYLKTKFNDDLEIINVEGTVPYYKYTP